MVTMLIRANTDSSFLNKSAPAAGEQLDALSNILDAAELSRLNGEPSVSVSEAQARLETKYNAYRERDLCSIT